MTVFEYPNRRVGRMRGDDRRHLFTAPHPSNPFWASTACTDQAYVCDVELLDGEPVDCPLCLEHVIFGVAYMPSAYLLYGTGPRIARQPLWSAASTTSEAG